MITLCPDCIFFELQSLHPFECRFQQRNSAIKQIYAPCELDTNVASETSDRAASDVHNIEHVNTHTKIFSRTDNSPLSY